MAKYKKSLPYICCILLALGSIACKSEGRQAPVRSCASNAKVKTIAEKPVACVVIDDKALAALSKQKAAVVYCVAMGASWGGTIVDPTVIVGMPKDINNYDKFVANGIDVYIKKGTNTLNGTITITAENAFWQEMFIAKGIAQ